MASFWEDSWKQVDPDRVAAYIHSFSPEADEVIHRLLAHRVRAVCDAGCGCGIYARKLAAHGFEVSGFDVSRCAVETARRLLEAASVAADLKTASILDTGYPDGQFDGVVSRDVLDHMTLADGIQAVRELVRITRPGGVIFLTLDHLDPEYEGEPHTVNGDGDFLFTAGKWTGMVFHPYSVREISRLIPEGVDWDVRDSEDGLFVCLQKPA